MGSAHPKGRWVHSRNFLKYVKQCFVSGLKLGLGGLSPPRRKFLAPPLVKTNSIFGIRTISKSTYVCSKLFCRHFFFLKKFSPGSHSGISQKINFIKTPLLLFSYMSLCILLTFCTFWTYFSLFQWFFHKIDFWLNHCCICMYITEK